MNYHGSKGSFEDFDLLRSCIFYFEVLFFPGFPLLGWPSGHSAEDVIVQLLPELCNLSIYYFL